MEIVTVKCELCDKQIPKDKAIEIRNGVYVCQECFDENFVVCEECGKFLHILYDAVPVYDGYYFVCDDCYEKGYEACEICERILPKDEVYYDKKRKMYICIYCLEELNQRGVSNVSDSPNKM